VRRGVSSALLYSERLFYRPVESADVDAFHLLVQDEHVRRYLMDGNVFPREWSEERVRESERSFAERGVGIWLVHAKEIGELVGFCGFLRFADMQSDPQLVYALLEPFTGKGYATEMARASIGWAREHAGFTEVIASVDEVNVASAHVLEKLGFERVETTEGSFGAMLLLRLRLAY